MMCECRNLLQPPEVTIATRESTYNGVVDRDRAYNEHMWGHYPAAGGGTGQDTAGEYPIGLGAMGGYATRGDWHPPIAGPAGQFNNGYVPQVTVLVASFSPDL